LSPRNTDATWPFGFRREQLLSEAEIDPAAVEQENLDAKARH
jgi:hypothetical protein